MNHDEKLSSTIFNLGRLIKERIHTSKCLFDFTQSEMEVLKFLDGKKNITMKDIADYLHIKPSSATPVIESLVKRKLLTRTQSDSDRRIIYIALSSKGKEELKEKYKNVRNTIKTIFQGLNDNDKKKLIDIFSKIND